MEMNAFGMGVIFTILIIAILIQVYYQSRVIKKKEKDTKTMYELISSNLNSTNENYKDFLINHEESIFVISEQGEIIIYSKQQKAIVHQFNFDDVVGYEISQDNAVTDGTKNAVVGAALFGTIGAIVGASSGGKREIKKMELIFYFDNFEKSVCIVPIISKKSEIDSPRVKRVFDDLNEIHGLFRMFENKRKVQ